VKTCPVCAREFPDTVKFCPNDGQTLRAKGPLADLVGQVVADRYHIIKKLGEGGMGTVYLGEHVKMGRKSAIKVMTQSMANDPDAVSRFNREASNASRLSHPNICQIYDFGETSEGLIYLAMEFIEGCSLSDLIEREGALPPQRAASILRQSADALQVAHDQTIVHRDIKPDNIMIVQAKDGSDVAKVVDFGIAKAVAGDETGQKVTKTGLVVGTPEYMSPEQLSGDKLDGRSDIYSLALVLYKMLTGVLPFQSDTAQETMIKRLTDLPEPLAQARPDIVFPPALQTAMDRALARLVSERYASAAEFGRDVVAAVGGIAVPETRMDVKSVTSAATQLLDTEMALKSVKRKEPAAAAPAPAKKFPLVPVLGGVGGVGVLAVIAVLTLGKGGGGGAGADSTGAAANQPAQTGGQTPAAGSTTSAPTGSAPNPQTAQANPRTPATRQPVVVPQNVTANPTGTVTQPPAGGAARWADTLRVANDLFDADQYAAARAKASAVYASASTREKVSAAILLASCYQAELNNERAIYWWEQVLRLSPGHSGATGALQRLGAINP